MGNVVLTLFPALSYGAAMHMVLLLFAFREAPIPDHGGMLLWWGFLILYHILLSVFLCRPRDLRSLVLFSGGVLVCQFAVTLWLLPLHSSFTWWLSSVGMWAVSYYQCARAHMEDVKPEALMTNFEVMVLSLFAAAVIITGNAMHIGVLLHLAVGLLCVMAAMIRLRTRHTRVDAQGEHPMARLLLPFLLLGTGGCAVLLVVLISGHAAALLTRFTAWLLQMWRLLIGLLGDFFMWLFSLFPEVDGDMDAGGFDAPALPSGAMEGMAESSPVLLYLLIAAFLVGLLFVVTRIWRTVRLQGNRPVRRVSRPVAVKRQSLADILGRFFRRVMGRVGYALRYLGSRNTPQGLLVWLNRRLQRRRMGRRQGETVAEFLSRTAELLPDCGEELRGLSRCLDRCYFGGGDTMPAETVREMRRKLGKALKENA